MTTEQLTELRRLLDAVDSRNVLRPTQNRWNGFALACRLALPGLLDAAEREAKLREALEKLIAEAERASGNQYLQHRLSDARAALSEGGAK